MIHQYKLLGYNIVLDICSGSVHAVDELAYDVISMFEQNDTAAIVAALSGKYEGGGGGGPPRRGGGARGGAESTRRAPGAGQIFLLL